MEFEMQELSTSSGSEIDASDLEVADSEIVRALHTPDPQTRPVSSHSRVHTAVRAVGMLFLVVAVIGALGFIFYSQREQELEQRELFDELKMVESFVQYEPEVLPVEGDLDAIALKTTDPPPM